VKHRNPLNVEREAEIRLSEFLACIPGLQVLDLQKEPVDRGCALRAHISFADRLFELVCEVKANGQPRFIRDAVLLLRHYIQAERTNAIPIVIAPYLSEQARQLCRQEQVGFLDFEGNAHIAFETVYIERLVAGTPKAEKRALRSLFKPKSARVLRSLLQHPGRQWRILELAQEADVSAGHVSTIGAALREREWADQTDEGLVLTVPDALLDAWLADYERPEGQEHRFYTHLHGAELDDALRPLMAPGSAGRLTLASYSAADWLAPYARNSSRYFYADAQGLDAFQSALALSRSSKGANIIIRVVTEDGVLADAVRPEPQILCTSPVQTYLDLMHAGERGAEAADYLRRTRLQW
jgi:Transcriptional regulator, AbiEi antitoxin, Type IV TA system